MRKLVDRSSFLSDNFAVVALLQFHFLLMIARFLVELLLIIIIAAAAEGKYLFGNSVFVWGEVSVAALSFVGLGCFGCVCLFNKAWI